MSNHLGRKPRSMGQADRNFELERLLVEGEMVDGGDGRQRRVYPLGKDIAERLGVSNAWVSKYAKVHRCFERRRTLQKSTREEATRKLIELESTRLAFDTERTLALCDRVLASYDDMLRERGMSSFTATDLNTIVRLRRFLEGDADSRQEVTSSITLETLQVAHRDMMNRIHDVTAEECGMEPGDAAPPAESPHTLPFEEAAGQGEIDSEMHQAKSAPNVREGTKPDI